MGLFNRSHSADDSRPSASKADFHASEKKSDYLKEWGRKLAEAGGVEPSTDLVYEHGIMAAAGLMAKFGYPPDIQYNSDGEANQDMLGAFDQFYATSLDLRREGHTDVDVDALCVEWLNATFDRWAADLRSSQ